jgi:hypothetical protein
MLAVLLTVIAAKKKKKQYYNNAPWRLKALSSLGKNSVK